MRVLEFPQSNSRAIAGVLDGMTKEGYGESIKPGAEFGVELRRSVVSTFVRERRVARKNAEQRAQNAAQARVIRRKIAELERNGREVSPEGLAPIWD